MTNRPQPQRELRCGMAGGHFIPGCWGGVLHGKSGCTCPTPEPDSARIDKLEAKVSRLMEQVRELRKWKL